MAIVQSLGVVDLPYQSGLNTLVAQPDVYNPTYRHITGYYNPTNATDLDNVSGGLKYPDMPPASDPCARISYITGKGIRLNPDTARDLTTACAAAKGVAPGQPARYDSETGEAMVVDPTTGEYVPAASVTPWYKRPTTWLIGGAAVLGVWLITK